MVFISNRGRRWPIGKVTFKPVKPVWNHFPSRHKSNLRNSRKPESVQTGHLCRWSRFAGFEARWPHFLPRHYRELRRHFRSGYRHFRWLLLQYFDHFASLKSPVFRQLPFPLAADSPSPVQFKLLNREGAQTGVDKVQRRMPDHFDKERKDQKVAERAKQLPIGGRENRDNQLVVSSSPDIVCHLDGSFFTWIGHKFVPFAVCKDRK